MRVTGCIALFALSSAASAVASVPVDLSAAFNISDGIVTDGFAFNSGGLDNGGAAFSANLLGTSLIFAGVKFGLGPANAPDAVSSTTIPLPERRFSTLALLATGVQGNQTSQVFTITYTDGSTATVTQSLSDWFTPQGFPGESIALPMSHRDYFDGSIDNRDFNVYAYTFPVNPGKSLASLTLPNNRNVVVLGVSLSITPVSVAPITLSLPFNDIGIVNDGTTFSGGLAGTNEAYSANLLGPSQNYDGLPFSFGIPNEPNVVLARGQTISLPAGAFAALALLATGTNGAQKGQAFTVRYADGTTTTFTQSFSDWTTQAAFNGESPAVKMAYRDTGGGGMTNQTTWLFAYFLALDPTKNVASLILPVDADVAILAATISPVPVIPPPTGGICGTAQTGGGEPGNVPYFRVYSSPLTTWCVNSAMWNQPASQAAIKTFFAYGDAVIAQDIALFHNKPVNLPFIFEITTPTGGASTGNDFGLGDTVTGDAFTTPATNPKTGAVVPGFWGYLLTLHESINVFTGLVSPDWPTDWWADHRSPFPNAMDEEFMRAIGKAENNATLLAAADVQHERFADPAQSGYDSEVAMFENFFTEFGGTFTPFSNTFALVQEDGLDWVTVNGESGPTDDNHGEKLSEYVIAYLQLGFHTTTDLTQTFINAGVGTKDTTIPSYTPSAINVADIANAHCSIRAAANAGQNVSSALAALQTGQFMNVKVTAACNSFCPKECGCNTAQNRCVAPWETK